MRRQNIRTLALIVVTFTYLLVGAAIFDVIESGHEIEARRVHFEEEQRWKALYNISDEAYENITDLVLKMKPYKAGSEQWKFAGAFYFSTTLITTIGYGHSTPKTRTGKVVCMLYSLIGIPLCIVMFQSIGERLNALITFILRSLKRLFRCKNSEVSQTNLIVVSINIGTLVLAAGAALFSYYESWDYLDSVYYCFITLTTVGFGDMVALQKNDQLKNRPDYVLFSLVFIMAGLTVVSSAMNLMVLRFLTMNTEDVRREELEQAAAAREAIRLEGDVINANGSVLRADSVATMPDWPEESAEPVASAASPSTGCLPGWCCPRKMRRQKRHQRLLPSSIASAAASVTAGGEGGRYTIARRPGKIHHLLCPQRSSLRIHSAVVAAAAATAAEAAAAQRLWPAVSQVATSAQVASAWCHHRKRASI